MFFFFFVVDSIVQVTTKLIWMRMVNLNQMQKSSFFFQLHLENLLSAILRLIEEEACSASPIMYKLSLFFSNLNPTLSKCSFYFVRWGLDFTSGL